jgi:hypothetical protein
MLPFSQSEVKMEDVANELPQELERPPQGAALPKNTGTHEKACAIVTMSEEVDVRFGWKRYLF